MKRRDANAIMIAFAAVSGAVIAYSLPVRLYEVVISTSGISEIIPAAAPPLGTTAQYLIVIAAALACATLAALLLPWSRSGDSERKRGNFMTFAFSRLAFLKRGAGFRAGFRKGPLSLEDNSPVFEPDPAPSIRRSDAHPDAPPRPPVFASRDLGGEAFPRVEDVDVVGNEGPQPIVQTIVQDITGLSMPRAPEPLPWDAIEQEMERLLRSTRSHDAADLAGGGEESARRPSIHELADRLERGLAARRARRQPYADMVDVELELVNVSPPMNDIQDSAAKTAEEKTADRGEGLEEALAALRSITAREK